jgi:hypothetical protein
MFPISIGVYKDNAKSHMAEQVLCPSFEVQVLALRGFFKIISFNEVMQHVRNMDTAANTHVIFSCA